MRVCNRCGTMVEDGIAVCPNCQTPLSGNEQMASQPMMNGMYQNNVQAEPRLGTKWADFLGYFALWVGGLINIISGLRCFGAIGASSLYILFAVCFIVTGVVDFITAIKIIKRKADAKKFVLLTYTLVVAVNALSVLFALTSEGDIMTQLASVIVGIIMIVVNNIYFSNRENIFVN